MLRGVGPTAIVARMLTNLDRSYQRRGDLASLTWVTRLRIALRDRPAVEQLDVAGRAAALGWIDQAAEVLDRVAGQRNLRQSSYVGCVDARSPCEPRSTEGTQMRPTCPSPRTAARCAGRACADACSALPVAKGQGADASCASSSGCSDEHAVDNNVDGKAKPLFAIAGDHLRGVGGEKWEPVGR